MVIICVLINLVGGLTSAILPGVAQAANDGFAKGLKILFTLAGIMLLIILVAIFDPGWMLTHVFFDGFRYLFVTSRLIEGLSTLLMIVEVVFLSLFVVFWDPRWLTEFIIDGLSLLFYVIYFIQIGDALEIIEAEWFLPYL